MKCNADEGRKINRAQRIMEEQAAEEEDEDDGEDSAAPGGGEGDYANTYAAWRPKPLLCDCRMGPLLSQL